MDVKELKEKVLQLIDLFNQLNNKAKKVEELQQAVNVKIGSHIPINEKQADGTYKLKRVDYSAIKSNIQVLNTISLPKGQSVLIDVPDGSDLEKVKIHFNDYVGFYLDSSCTKFIADNDLGDDYDLRVILNVYQKVYAKAENTDNKITPIIFNY